jgi:hypothetical protein
MKTTFLKTLFNMVPGAMLALTIMQNAVFAKGAHDKTCSNASLEGGYGTQAATVLPAGRLFGVVGRFSFDGKGSWTLTLTINDNGAVSRVNDSGTYTVKADCTGTLFPRSPGTVEIVLVDGGKEILGLRTDSLIFVSGTIKKQFPDDDEDR